MSGDTGGLKRVIFRSKALLLAISRVLLKEAFEEERAALGDAVPQASGQRSRRDAGECGFCFCFVPLVARSQCAANMMSSLLYTSGMRLLVF